MRRKHLATSGVLCVAALVLAACGSTNNSSSSSSSSSSGGSGSGGAITVGVLNSNSGVFSAGFAGTQSGIDARLKSYAASGGKCSSVNISTVPEDDQSSPQGALAAVQKAVIHAKVFAIPNNSSFLF